MNHNNERTCNKCGHVHFAVSLDYAEEEVKRFNEMFEELTAAEKQRYYGGRKASIELYERCIRCGNSYKDLREAKEDDCPAGCTLSPILEDL